MASIRKHRGKFQVRIRRQGAPDLSRSFAKLSDAKEWANLQECRADRGELGPDRKELEQISLSDLVTRYRNEIVPAKKCAANETITLNAFLRHPICKKRLSDLTTADFASYRDERLKEIEGQSLKRLLSPLSNMFEIARSEWEIPVRSNPLATLSLKASDNRRQRRLQAGEYDRLIAAADKTRNPYLILVARFALATCMRRGEILSLRPRDIDFQRQTATIRDTKNGHSRIVPLTDEAVTAIESAIAFAASSARTGTKSPAPKVLKIPRKPRTETTVFPVTPMALRLAWDRLTERAGLDDLHFHDLRHEAISRLFEMGLTVPEVASISGHRTLNQLMRYAHANNLSVRAKLSLQHHSIGATPPVR